MLNVAVSCVCKDCPETQSVAGISYYANPDNRQMNSLTSAPSIGGYKSMLGSSPLESLGVQPIIVGSKKSPNRYIILTETARQFVLLATS